MAIKFNRRVIIGGMIWIIGVLVYVGSNVGLFRTAGEWDYGTITSDTFNDPVKARPYDEIAPEVCDEFNSRVLQDLKNDFHTTEPIKLVLQYRGKGLYTASFDCRGYGVASMIHYLLRDTILAAYNKAAIKHGLPTKESLGESGGSGEDILAGHARAIITFTLLLSVYMTWQINRMFKKQEAGIGQKM